MVLTSKIKENVLLSSETFDDFIANKKEVILNAFKNILLTKADKNNYPSIEVEFDLILKESAYDFIEQLGDEIYGEEHNLYGKTKDVIDELFDEFSLDEIKQMVIGTFFEKDLIDIEDENELKDILISAYYEDLSLSYLNDTKKFLDFKTPVSIVNNHINETKTDFTSLEYLKPDIVYLLSKLLQGFSSYEEKEVFEDSLKAILDGKTLSDFNKHDLKNQNGLLHFLNEHGVTEDDFKILLHSNKTINDERKDLKYFIENVLKELASLEDDVGLKTSFTYLTKMSYLDFTKTSLINKLYLDETQLPFNVCKNLEDLNLSVSIKPNSYCGLVSKFYNKTSDFDLTTTKEVKIPLIYAHLSQENHASFLNYLKKPLIDINFDFIKKLNLNSYAEIVQEKTSLDYDLKEKLHHKIKQQSRMQNLNIQLKS